MTSICDSIYTDFSKEFDRLHHSILILSLKNLVLTGEFLNWIKSYLTGQTQVVHFLGNFSKTISVFQESHKAAI